MDYQTFTMELADLVNRELGSEHMARICRIPKNNGIVRESMTVKGETGEAVPLVDLGQFYHLYQQGEAMENLAGRIIGNCKGRKMQMLGDGSFFSDFEKAREHICFRVVNLEKNLELLSQIPYRMVLDLAVVYYYRFEDFDSSQASILIYKEHMEAWGVEEEELWRIARDNSEERLSPQLVTLRQLVLDLCDEEDSLHLPELSPEDEMFVLSNRERYFGAAVLFYDEIPEKLGEALKNNFYILPSSIHECIIVPDSGLISPFKLRNMVKEVNEMCVVPEEVLSDQVYYFERKKGVLSIA